VQSIMEECELTYRDILNEAVVSLLEGDNEQHRLAFALRFCSIVDLRLSPPLNQLFHVLFSGTKCYDVVMKVNDRSVFDFLVPPPTGFLEYIMGAPLLSNMWSPTPLDGVKSSLALALTHIYGRHCIIRKCKLVPNFPVGMESTASKDQAEMGIGDIFSNIRNEIDQSRIKEDLKEVALSDLTQAEACYSSGAYKACVVMLGAVLEGVMLGALQQVEVMDILRSDSALPKIPKLRKAICNPAYSHGDDFARLIADLNFDEYRQLCEHIFQTQDLGVEGIQHFRNAIHPWVVSEHPHLYKHYDRTRAIAHLAALEKLANQILGRQQFK